MNAYSQFKGIPIKIDLNFIYISIKNIFIYYRYFTEIIKYKNYILLINNNYIKYEI